MPLATKKRNKVWASASPITDRALDVCCPVDGLVVEFFLGLSCPKTLVILVGSPLGESGKGLENLSSLERANSADEEGCPTVV